MSLLPLLAFNTTVTKNTPEMGGEERARSLVFIVMVIINNQTKISHVIEVIHSNVFYEKE